MSHPEATHSDEQPTASVIASTSDESDEMDRAETVVYQALADNLMGRLNRGPQWNTIEQIMASLHDEARNILAALKAARIAIVELPEPTERGVFDDDCDEQAGWISFPEGVSATIPNGSVFDQDAELSPADAELLAASLLAAAAAVGARITVEEA